MNYLYIPIEDMPFGKERRAVIMKAFQDTEDAAYAVNCKWRPQLKDDPDLRKLVKTGKLLRLRTINRTYLVLNR